MRSLGPFQLTEIAGRGGMGVVWRGRHQVSGLPVAAKLLARPTDARSIAAFQAEVRLLAALDHPNIVALLDAGVLPSDIGDTPEGSPYLALEWIGGGSVADLPALRWEDLHGGVGALLSALAHAHARGVLHRDLKPGNVLLDEEGRWRLTDLGVARLQGERPARAEAAGTPLYMAPEQIRGDWRGEGPWTDLYALGCMIWELCSGLPPYTGTQERIMEAHLAGVLPAFRPACATPRGLETWLQRVLSGDPSGRFSRAADALTAWVALGPADLPPARNKLAPALRKQATTTWLLEPPAAPGEYSGVEAPHEPLPWVCPPEPPARTLLIVDAGQGLVGLRRPRLVGREGATAALWSALRESAEQSRPLAVILDGPTGAGRTRLLRWIAEAAHESGQGTPIWLGPGGLDVALQTALAGPDLAEADPAATAEERDFDGRITAVQTLGRGRLPVVLLDDVVADEDRLRWVEQLILARELQERPTLLVLAPQDRIADAAAFHALAARAGVRAVEVSPLQPAQVADALLSLLPLGPALIARLTESCGGLPRLAVAQLLDLVERDALVVGVTGHALRPGAEISMPEDLIATWMARLERALEGQPAEGLLALELAATWGLDIEIATLDRLAASVGLAVPWGALAVLARRGTIEIEAANTDISERGRERLRFNHVLVREALLGRARRADRLPRWSGVCADALVPCPFDALGRLGALRIAAGRDEEALAPLLDAANRMVRVGNKRETLVLLRARGEALDRLRRPTDAPERMAAWECELSALRDSEAPEAMIELSSRRAALALAAGNLGLWALMRKEAAMSAHWLGRSEDGIAQLREVRAAIAGTDLLQSQGSVVYSLAILLRRQGQLDEAHTLAEEAMNHAIALGWRRGMGSALRLLGDIDRIRGRRAEARAYVERALAVSISEGDVELLAHCHNVLGELARYSGNLDEAAAHYQASIAAFSRVGLIGALVIGMNLGTILLLRGQQADARPLARRALHTHFAHNRLYYHAAAHLQLLLCEALDGRWSAFDVHLDAARDLLELSGSTDPDFPLLARLAGDAAEAAGQQARAEAARKIAARQEERTGR